MPKLNTDTPEVTRLKEHIAELESRLRGFEQTRLKLREDHSFRKAIIEKAAEGICVCHGVPEHPHVKFTVWNSRMEQLTGYTLEDINAKGWYQSLYPDEEIQAAAKSRMESMREGDDLKHERWVITRSDGEKRTVGISTSTLKTADGANHVLAMMQDVTIEEQYRSFLEGRLKDLERLLPICSWCKNIRDQDDNWHPLERYIGQQYDASFTHGICPDCQARFNSDNKG